MKTIALALAFVACAATADPRVDNMTAQCKVVMDAGVCRVALDPKDYPNPTILIAGLGRISTESYLKVRGTGEAKNADGSWKMCSLAKKFCTAAKWDSDDCKVIRSLWSQLPPAVQAPGNNTSASIR